METKPCEECKSNRWKTKVKGKKWQCRVCSLFVNNMDTFRKEYIPLTDEQELAVADIKNYADSLLTRLNKYTPLPGVNNEAGRCMAFAKTNLEQAIMWAVKAVTTKQE